MGDVGSNRDDATDRFVAYIDGLDPGGKAALRRSLAFTPGSWPGAFRYVEPWVSTREPWERQMTYLVAGLQAQSRAERAQGDLGAAAHQLALATESSSVETRFLALLDADSEQLPHRIRQMITLMSSKQIAPDWAGLRRDLLHWRSENRWVQQRWARSFYSSPDRTGADTETQAATGARTTNAKDQALEDEE